MNGKSKEYFQPTVVFVFLLLLSSYLLLARLSSGSILGSDSYTMQNVLHWDCNLAFQTFMPPVRCLGSLIEFIFRYPPLYLACLIALKGFTLFLLYRVFMVFDKCNYSQSVRSTLALFAVLFLVVGIRQFHLGIDILLSSDLHTRMWAEALIIFSLLLFFNGKYLITSIVLGVAVFLQAINTLNVVLVLLITIIILYGPKGFLRPTLWLALPVCVAASVQYIAAYGMPDLEIADLFFDDHTEVLGGEEHGTDTSLDVADSKESGSNKGYSVGAWYDYVYSQDRDDLSLKYLLNSRLGFAYLVFQLLGLYFSISYRGRKPNNNILSDPIIAVCLATYAYLLACLIVEHFQIPGFILEKLIILQPRRVLYLPLIVLSYAITKSVFQFFTMKAYCTTRRFIEILILFLVIFVMLEFTSDRYEFLEISYRKVVKLIFYGAFLSGLSLYFFLRNREIISEKLIQSNRSIIPIFALIAVVLKSLSATSVGVLSDAKQLFGELGPRSYSQYLLVEGNIGGRDLEVENLLGATNWAASTLNANDRILTVGFQEGWEMSFVALTKLHTTSMNVYRYRGAFHYSFASFERQIEYFEGLLGLPASEMGREDGTTIIGKLDMVVNNLDRNSISELRQPDGKPFDFIFSRGQLPTDWHIVFSNRSFVAYQRPK